MIGSVFGYWIPRLVHRWRLDPRIASGPIVTAVAELAALSFYLTASQLLI
jgi:Mg/Co/Ni transporter MgtE